MRKQYLYSFEIDVSDHECDDYARWANYGTLVAEGNMLDECLENASVDIMDQDGGEINTVPADLNWMQDLIEEMFLECLERAEAERRRKQAYLDEGSDDDARSER